MPCNTIVTWQYILCPSTFCIIPEPPVWWSEDLVWTMPMQMGPIATIVASSWLVFWKEGDLASAYNCPAWHHHLIKKSTLGAWVRIWFCLDKTEQEGSTCYRCQCGTLGNQVEMKRHQPNIAKDSYHIYHLPCYLFVQMSCTLNANKIDVSQSLTAVLGLGFNV